MVRTVCLNEDKHSVTMLRGLKQMRHEDDFCDFTIKVQCNEYRVHRNIVAVASPYFKAMLKHDTKESRRGKVEMKDVDAECVKSCIDFIYSGKFDIPDGKMAKLMHVAIMMQLDDVKNAVCRILDEELNADNFYEAINIAETFDLTAVSSKCEIFYMENLVAISTQPGFENESKSHVIDILPNLNLNKDDQLVVSLRWVGDDPERKEELVEFIKHVDLNGVSLRCLSDILQNFPVINNDLYLYKLVNAPLVEYVETNTGRDEGSLDHCYRDENLILFNKSANFLQSYSPITSEVTKFRNAGFTHFGDFTAIFMNSYIYVLCRQKSVHRLNCLNENSKWEQLSNMITDHGSWPPCVSLSGSLFVIGHGDTSHSTNDVELFNPVANEWLKLDAKPTPMCRAALVSLDDSIYCIGGQNGRETLKSFCKFTPFTSHWTDLTPLRNPRRSCGAAVVDKKIYIAGGWRGPSVKIQDVESYDVNSRQWTSLSPNLSSLGLSVAYHVGGWIFVFPRSWSNASGYSDEIQKYDIVNDNWSIVKCKGVGRFCVYDCVLVHSS